MINNDLQTLDRKLKIEQVKPPKIQVLSFYSKGGTRPVTNIRHEYHVICTIAFIVFRNTYSNFVQQLSENIFLFSGFPVVMGTMLYLLEYNNSQEICILT